MAVLTRTGPQPWRCPSAGPLALHTLLVAVLTMLLAMMSPAGAATSGPAGAAPPGPAGAADHPGRPDRTLTVVTYNIHHAQGADGVLELDRVAGVLRDSGAAVIALQEVDKHYGDRSENADQASMLGQKLHMQVAFGANLDLDPAKPGDPRRQYGTAILSKYPIRWSGNTLLPKFPNGEQRGLLQAIVLVRGVPVRVMNTHLQHNNTPERLAQIEAIKKLTGNAPGPTVLMGDMNAPPESIEYAQLTEKFRDVWPLVGDGPGFTFDSDNPLGRIDFVLTFGQVTPKAAEVLQTLASDHLPVRAVLALSAGGHP
jgi:endonuclease/exonuclease/phosphatase family metal-dependent hydrolase